MTTMVDAAVDAFAPIDLDELDRCAKLLTRKDRKYIVDPDGLATVLAALPAEARALVTEAGRWSTYESTYFDTADLDSFRLAATRRRNRFKVRTRHYVDSATAMMEVKTKDRRGRTAKRRRPLEGAGLHDPALDLTGPVRRFAGTFDQVERFAAQLQPCLATRYRRATIALPDRATRITIDADYRAVDTAGGVTGLGELLVVETKTDGQPSVADRLLWRAGYRPVKFSKYATALAALHPQLPHNRWNRVLVDHFDRSRTAISAPRARSRAASASLPMIQEDLHR